MLRLYVDSKLGKYGNSGECMSAAGDQIPCKSAKSQISFNTSGGGEGEGGSGDTSNTSYGNPSKARTKECDLCVQYNPHAKITPWPSEWTRYNMDGSRKEGAHHYNGAGTSDGNKPCYNNTIVMDLNKQKKSSRSFKRSTSARRSIVKEEDDTTLPAAAPHHLLIMNKMMGALIPIGCKLRQTELHIVQANKTMLLFFF